MNSELVLRSAVETGHSQITYYFRFDVSTGKPESVDVILRLPSDVDVPRRVSMKEVLELGGCLDADS